MAVGTIPLAMSARFNEARVVHAGEQTHSEVSSYQRLPVNSASTCGLRAIPVEATVGA